MRWASGLLGAWSCELGAASLIPARLGSSSQPRKDSFEITDDSFQTFCLRQGGEQALLEVEVEGKRSGEKERKIGGGLVGSGEIRTCNLGYLGVEAHGLLD